MLRLNLHGQPQCLKNVTTVGLPSDTGKLSFPVEGALSPTAGVVPVFTAAGDIHDQNSLDNVMMYYEDALQDNYSM